MTIKASYKSAERRIHGVLRQWQGWGSYSLAEGSGVVTEEFLEHVTVTIWVKLHLAFLDNGESSFD